MNMGIEDLKKEIARLRIENDLLKAIVNNNPNDPRLKALDLVVQALEMEEFSNLPAEMEVISGEQIESAFEGGISSQIKRVHVRSAQSGSKGGKISAEQRQDDVVDRNIKIANRAIKLRMEKREPHEIAGILAEQYKLSVRQIRNILKKAES
jgi:hypothetical protein